LLHPRLALRDQYFLYRLLAVTDTNEGDYASVSVLVGTNPHKLQVTAIDERLQRVATHVDCRQSHFAAIGQQHRPPVANDSVSSGGRRLARFLPLARGPKLSDTQWTRP